MRPAVPSLAFAAVVALAARPALAQSPDRVPMHLRWNAPIECPTRGEVVASIARLIHRTPDTPAGEPFAADAEVSCAPGRGCSIDMETVSPAGSARRVFDGRDCAEVSSAAALIIALALEPDFAGEAIDAERPPGTPAGDHEPAGPVRAHPRPAPPNGLPDPVTDRPRPYFHAGTGIDVGSLPSPTPTAHAAIGLTYGPLRFELAGTYLSPQRAVLRATDGSGIDVFLFEIEARACGRALHGRLEYGACGAAGSGSMHGRAVNISGPGTEYGAPWVALIAGSYAAVRLYPWFALHVSVDLGAAVTAPRFEITTPNGAFGYGPPVIFARGVLTAEIRLP